MSSPGLLRIPLTIIRLCEHTYWARAEDEARGVLSFPPAVAPTKVLIVPLSSHNDFKPFVQMLSDKLDDLGISSRYVIHPP